MEMKRFNIYLFLFLFVIGISNSAQAHFGMVIPSDNMILQTGDRSVNLVLSFSHPFEMIGMPLEKPVKFIVAGPQDNVDLTPGLDPVQVMNQPGWQTTFKMKRPGTYLFVMEPKPFWEPAEDCFIVHYTKTYVTAFGDDTGWDRELNLATEIVPLTRPFALYSGNLFQGVVKLHGKPVPYAEIEVEFYNEKRKAKAVNEYFITQTIKSDQKGMFSYAAPKAGWWGFAALSTSPDKKQFNGKEKDIEMGAVIWVKFESWKENE